jgi:hypothetical protein
MVWPIGKEADRIGFFPCIIVNSIGSITLWCSKSNNLDETKSLVNKGNLAAYIGPTYLPCHRALLLI